MEVEQHRQLNYGDRFVRSRDEVDRLRGKLAEPEPDFAHRGMNDLVYKQLYSTCKEEYKKLLASALSVSRQSETSTYEPLWPVKSRRKPIIRSADIVLDLPSIKSNFCHNLMDWSSTDFLTVAFPHSVYLWHAETYTTMRFLAPNPTCIKWNPIGTKVLTAVRHGDVKVVYVERSREWVTCEERTCHFSCYVTSAAYHPSQPCFLVGCSKGGFEMYNSDKVSERIFLKDDYNTPVTQVAFSCNGRYYAVTTMSGYVGVYTGLWSCQPVGEAKVKGPTRAIAWHPWKASCLVAGDTSGNIYVYDIARSSNTLHVVGEFNPVFKNPIYAMSFNPVSAELVVSYRLRNNGVSLLDDDDHASLVVLASLDRVVDKMTGDWGATNFLSWSPDGSQLATAGRDESARIWGFLPQRRPLQKPVKKPLHELWSNKKKPPSNYLQLELEDMFWCTLR